MSVASHFTQSELANRQLRLAQFSVDNAAAPIFWTDSNFQFVYVNKKAVRSLGYSREELLSMRVCEIDPLFPEPICRAVWRHLKKEGFLEFETVHRRKDGTEFPVWIISSFYRDGDTEMSFSFCRDLTGKKAAEAALLRANEDLEQRVLRRTEELAASEARYQDLYHNAPDMFASIDAASGCVVQCNLTLANTLGCRFDDLLGRSFVEIFDDASRAAAESAWATFLSSGEAKRRWLTLRGKDEGLIVSVSMTAVRDESGKILLARSSMRDITEIRRATIEAERHRSELAHVARLATTGEMAAGLAHELNQPLYAVTNFSKGAIRRLESGALDRESLLGVLRDIAEESQRAAEIIRSLRRYVGKRESRRTLADLNQSAMRVVGLLGMESSQRQGAIELCVTEPLPAVSCDVIQIEQVLMNLVLNALEATSGCPANGRKIEVASRVIDKKWVEFAVTDHGMGLPHDGEERIFDAFYSTKTDGLGLGLTISRRIVEAHGGCLKVASNSEGGVTASFVLPIARNR